MDHTEYMASYEKENLRQIRLKINRKTEPELLEWIEKQENIQGYIKKLIWEDMKKEKVYPLPEWCSKRKGGKNCILCHVDCEYRG